MIQNVTLSLADVVGEEYLDAVINVASVLNGTPASELNAIATAPVEFFPTAFEKRSRELAVLTGTQIVPAFESNLEGAPTASYLAAQHNAAAPLGGLGCSRVGEDGRVYLAAKSEHYHLSLGHAFPGYDLIEKAKALGIPNATHNNARGHITRLAERSLIAAANGVGRDGASMDAILSSTDPRVLNRVINLETGSLAVEAAIKMMLNRFYDAQGGTAEFDGLTPVFLVMADNAGGPTANYHGTTVIAQTLRGLWPTFSAKLEEAGIYKVVPVTINDIADFRSKFEQYNSGKFRIAGFSHEIVMMNYGGIVLEQDYLREAYSICHDGGAFVLCDEIQSCAWYEELFLFRRLGLTPDFVAIGKGFPGGTYPASRILTTSSADNLAQFGALVTNGQEELASLSYLITMAFVQANGAHIQDTGGYFQAKMSELVRRFPAELSAAYGDQHMTGLAFREGDVAGRFCTILEQEYAIDISAQTYKPGAPPVALTKLPLVADRTTVDVIVDRMARALSSVSAPDSSPYARTNR